jgi:RecB family exonuclease
VPAAAGLLDRGWINEGFASDAQSAAARDRARGLVENYVAGLDPADEPAGVERTVGARTDQITFSGRIDRLDDRRSADGGRELVVVDYKTGRRPLSTDDARSSLPLALYAVAAARVLRRTCHRVELHHLPTGTVHAWEHTPATLDRHVGRAEDIAAECADADQRYRDGLPPGGLDEVFPPSPGPGCGWCDFRAVCPEGSAATSARRPWDGLEELSGN